MARQNVGAKQTTATPLAEATELGIDDEYCAARGAGHAPT